MCGFVGAVHTDAEPPLTEGLLVHARDTITHRGPDDAGHHLGPGVALASRRLAILDLSSRGHMPMHSSDGRYTIIYNGEVYNFRELRSAMESRGHTFRSNTDTEVVLALFQDRGPDMLTELNGMFALAIWDSRERTLFLARDRVGIKPLYYAQTGDRLVFGSEEKSLFATGVSAEFDPAAWHELLRFNYVAGERTPFAGVRRLLPGHSLIWKNGHVTIRRWWKLADRIAEHRDGIADRAQAWFRETFDQSIDYQRISDVPVGVLLSGGLDSSSIAASLADQAGSGVASFTMRFKDDPQYDEGPLAQMVADKWELAHNELDIGAEGILDKLRNACWLNDAPLAHYSDLHIHAIAAYAKSRVTVLLSGEGADEMLGGYVRYWPLRHPAMLAAQRAVVPALSRLTGHRRVRKLQRMLSLGGLDQLVLFNTSNVFPDDLATLGLTASQDFAFREEVVREARAAYPGEPVRQAMYSDHHTFLCSLLDRNDRMTMGASIEARVPFLDHRLVEGLAALPSKALLRGRRGKRLLIDALGDRLPPEILKARKWGFSVPWQRYFREQPELREVIDGLADSDAVRQGPFDRASLQRVIKAFQAGSDAQAPLMVSLFMVSVWHDTYQKRVAEVRAAGRSTAPARA